MTHFFDSAAQRLRIIAEEGIVPFRDDIREFEEELVRDVDRCTASPGFPEELAKKIDLVVLKYAVYCQPLNRREDLKPQPDSSYEHVKLMQDLTGDLHTLFHEAVTKYGLSDSPLAAMRILEAKSEERREQIAEEEHKEPLG